MQKIFLKLAVIVLFLCISFLLQGGAVSSTKTKEAPSWDGVEWLNLAQGADSLSVSDLKGKVIYLSFFQKW